MPLRRITSFVSQLVAALALLAFFAMSHFNQGPVFEGSFDLVIAGVQERSCNLPEATHATCSTVFISERGRGIRSDLAAPA